MNTKTLPLPLPAPHAVRTACTLALAVAAALVARPAHAFDQQFSGFGTLAAGRTAGTCVTDAAMATAYDSFCTRYIADWAHAGVYTPEWSAKAESRAGLQWTGNFSSSLSATAQVMGRLTPGTKAGLEWAYLTWKPNDSWTLQAGRKRLPLYYFSDFQDVGYAQQMVRPSPDVYGWDVVNYNGASADYSTDVGDWTVRASVYGGAEDSRKNRYTLLIQDGSYDVKWGGIVGTSVEASHDWLTIRASFTQSNFQQVDRSTGEVQALYNGKTTGRQSFYGVALIADYGDWVGRAELASSRRPDQGYDANFWYVSAGRHFGDWTPMVQVSQYREKSTVGDAYAPLDNRTLSASVRYEINGWSDLKLQFDRDQDRAAAHFTGSANVYTVAYDFTF